MPSKKSKPASTRRPSSKAERGCSEARLGELARELGGLLKPGDRVLLEGPMGAGKSTFARALLLGLGVEQPPEGSPTFAIAHEYALRRDSRVVHIDLYRIRSEEEIDERGIPDTVWDAGVISLIEWSSMWPEFQRRVSKASVGAVWKVELGVASETTRDVSVTQLG